MNSPRKPIGRPLHDPAAYDRYVDVMETIPGWLDANTALIIRDTMEFQSEIGVTGPIAEIGLHHGRLFVVLCLSAQAGERVYGIDVFELQHLNVDNSGHGQRAAVLKAVKTYAPNTDIKLIRGDSNQIADQLVETLKGLRLISIDGGHTRQTTCSDLWIADRALQAGGIAILDDLYKADWSGVTAGLARYLHQGGRLVPFALFKGKLQLATSAEWAATYRDFLARTYAVRTIEFFEHDILFIDQDRRLVGIEPVARAPLQGSRSLSQRARSWIQAVLHRAG
jgi:hypothetical protein